MKYPRIWQMEMGSAIQVKNKSVHSFDQSTMFVIPVWQRDVMMAHNNVKKTSCPKHGCSAVAFLIVHTYGEICFHGVKNLLIHILYTYNYRSRQKLGANPRARKILRPRGAAKQENVQCPKGHRTSLWIGASFLLMKQKSRTRAWCVLLPEMCWGGFSFRVGLLRRLIILCPSDMIPAFECMITAEIIGDSCRSENLFGNFFKNLTSTLFE